MTKLLLLRPMLAGPALPATIEFWTGPFGFTVRGRLDDEKGRPLWCEVARDDVAVMFSSHYHDEPDGDHGHGEHHAELGGGLYVNVDDVDALAAELSSKVALEYGPQDMEYGMREFGVTDNNGFMIMFGQSI